MDMQAQILRCLRLSGDEVLLRSDISALGSPVAISSALKALVAQRALARIARGVYATPSVVALQGRQALLQQAASKAKLARRRLARIYRAGLTKRYVERLARREGVVFSPIFADRWADAVTRLADDDVKNDSTDDLLVALTRAGKLSPAEMAKLVMAHHRDAKHV